jgi:hypothetical protein
LLIGAELANEFGAWKMEAARLKTQRTNLSFQNKTFEDSIAAHDNDAKIVKWIKKEYDPKQTLGDIEREVTFKGKHEKRAQWFLESIDFEDWSQSLRGGQDIQTLNVCYGSKATTAQERPLWCTLSKSLRMFTP